MNKLAIIDWGIGGISIYKLFKAKHPGVGITYFSDTGATPYGKMSRSELSGRLDTVIDYLGGRGVTHIVIGCNAASTAIPYLAPIKMRIEGVIDAAVDETLRQRPESIGVIGGRRTILSGVYRRSFRSSGSNVAQRIAQPLSGMIESGDIGSDKLRAEARRILYPIRGCSHILLACTHYPAISSLLAEYVSPKTRFVDPAKAVLKKVSRWRFEDGGRDVFLTTGDPDAMKKAAELAFGVKIKKADVVDPGA